MLQTYGVMCFTECVLLAYLRSTVQYVYERIEGVRYLLLEHAALLHGEVQVVRGRQRVHRALNTQGLAGNNNSSDAVLGNARHVFLLELLIARLHHLVLGCQVHPEL